MAYFFTAVMLIDTVMAGYFGVKNLIVKDRNIKSKILLFFLSMSSALWSLGFAILCSVRRTELAYACRSVGLVGTFLYLVIIMVMLGGLANIPKKLQYGLDVAMLLLVPLYFCVIQPEQAKFRQGAWGMSYSLKASLVNSLYSGSMVVFAAIVMGYSIYMYRTTMWRREQVFAKRIMISVGVVFLGMLLDTVVPMIGLPAIPGSTISQFWGYVIVLAAIVSVEKTSLTVTNVSSFVYRSLAVPVCIYTMDGQLVLINDSGENFFRKSREALIGGEGSLEQLFDVDARIWKEFEDEQKVLQASCLVNNKECSIQIDKIRDLYGDALGYIVVVNDITEQVNTMKKLDVANKAKSNFLTNMSHEIRTPMNAIVGFSEILMKKELGKEEEEFLVNIRDSSYSLLSIIDDVIDVSMMENGKLELKNEEYDTKELFKEILMKSRGYADVKHLGMKWEFSDNIPSRLLGDKEKITSLLMNLVRNAVQYTEQGCVMLYVEAKVDDLAVLTIRVEDTGIGIEQQHLTTIFQAFEQAEDKLHTGIEGTGLGLAIVKGYLGLMKGKISVESTVGKGSVFTVIIPQCIVDSKPMEEIVLDARKEQYKEVEPMDIKNTRVLAVDDNLVNLKVISKILEGYGLQVDTVDSGAKAIEKCKEYNYPIIFMDQMMPEMDGIEAMHTIRDMYQYYKENNGGHIVALTANTVKGAREELMAEGFDEYLKKPMEYERLEKVLSDFIPEGNIHRGEKKVASKSSKSNHGVVFIHNVDTVKGMGYAGGNLDAYKEILEMTIDNGKEYLETMSSKIEQDLAGYIIEIHAIKGMCYNIGADVCGDRAKGLEMAARQKDVAFVRSHQQEFEVDFKRLLEELSNFLDSQGYQRRNSADKGFVDYLEDIRQATRNYDFPTVEKLLKKMKEGEWSSEECAKICYIEELVDNLDMEQLENI